MEPSLCWTPLSEVCAAGRCDSAQLWVLLLPPVRAQGFIERASDVQLNTSSPGLVLSISPFLFLSGMSANLFPNFHMKEAVGVNASAKESGTVLIIPLCLLPVRKMKSVNYFILCNFYK